MVGLDLTIKCPTCHKEQKFNAQSGEFERKIGRWECSHFKGDVFVSTKVGWLGGTNASVSMSLDILCLRCNQRRVVVVDATGIESRSNCLSGQFCENNGHSLILNYSQDSAIGSAVTWFKNLKMPWQK